jgi:hypothetical protein
MPRVEAMTITGLEAVLLNNLVGPHLPLRGPRFVDSPLEQAGFELVWGFSCQVVVLGFAESSLFGAGKPFFIPSPAIRFPERAEGVKGPKR